MPYRLSALSRRRLNGVHPDLVRVLEHAIGITPVDFRVQEGLRTQGRQQDLVRAGASKTLNSRHLTGHAVDLVALLGSVVRWDWALYVQIADAVRVAARATGVTVRWGGCWCELNALRGPDDLDAAVADYVARSRAAGKRPLLDGGHFELPRSRYP